MRVDFKTATMADCVRQRHSPIDNYILPGLTSWLVGDQPQERGAGLLRLFECTHNHQSAVAPHSHRFDFKARVLSGGVVNWLWHPTDVETPRTDLYASNTLRYAGSVGSYARSPGPVRQWTSLGFHYDIGESYSMRYTEVHSITFRKGTMVLLEEGKELTDLTTMLEPVIGGRVVPTGDVQWWMFQPRRAS